MASPKQTGFCCGPVLCEVSTEAPHVCIGCRAAPCFLSIGAVMWRDIMAREGQITPAKRKRLLKTFGSCPAGYTYDDLERFLDLLYGMYSNVYTSAELRQIIVSDPFDRSETPRHLKLVELVDWLEALTS